MQLTTSVSQLASHLGNRQSAFWAATSRKVADLSAQMARVPAGGGVALKTWSDRFSATLQSLEEDLDQQRQITSIGPTA
jgi:hypothetical protein